MRAKSIRLDVITLNSFDRLYAGIPAVACKGLCHESCGPVVMTNFEWDRILAKVGKVPAVQFVDDDGRNYCPLLNSEKKCDVHDVRPTLCRLFGVARGMPCPHGCEPTAWIDDETASHLIGKADVLGGGPNICQVALVAPEAAAAAFAEHTS